MQLAMILLVVVMQSALIPTGLLIMRAAWRMLIAFPAGDRLVPLRIHALDATLLVKKRVVGYGSLSFGASRKAVVAAM